MEVFNQPLEKKDIKQFLKMMATVEDIVNNDAKTLKELQALGGQYRGAHLLQMTVNVKFQEIVAENSGVNVPIHIIAARLKFADEILRDRDVARALPPRVSCNPDQDGSFNYPCDEPPIIIDMENVHLKLAAEPERLFYMLKNQMEREARFNYPEDSLTLYQKHREQLGGEMKRVSEIWFNAW
jgi:hypothetical protein